MRRANPRCAQILYPKLSFGVRKNLSRVCRDNVLQPLNSRCVIVGSHTTFTYAYFRFTWHSKALAEAKLKYAPKVVLQDSLGLHSTSLVAAFS
jgi:hypothetical protein